MTAELTQNDFSNAELSFFSRNLKELSVAAGCNVRTKTGKIRIKRGKGACSDLSLQGERDDQARGGRVD